MKRKIVFSLFMLASLSACTSSYLGNSSPNMPYPEAAPSGIPDGDLSSLLTGKVINEQEAQLRDTLKRKVLLDFPVKVGVMFYNFKSKLDAVDKEIVFKDLRSGLKNSGMISETIEIPQTLVGSMNIENLRQVGARFQTDIIVLITGNHQFARSRDQSIGFFDSFSNSAYYQSEMKMEAIALDVFTGTLLSPFDTASKGEPILLDRSASDYAVKAYAYQKQVEAKAWKSMEIEALDRFAQLKINVEKTRQEMLANPSPQPSANSESAKPVESPTPSPSASTQEVAQ